MRYPAIFHSENKSFCGLTIPDIPGPFIVGENPDDAVKNVQSYVELHFEGREDSILPKPSEVDDLMQTDSYADNRVWIFVEIDFSFMGQKI